MQRAAFVTAVSLFALLAFTPGCSKESAASGREGTRLALTKPSDQTLTQGESNDISISIERTGFADAVQVSFSNLPRGVRVDESAIPAGDNSKKFVLIAAPDAAVVTKQIVTVQARGAGITTPQTFELTVKPKS
jgi:hypothetical protein